MMDLDDLRAFVEVVESSGFNRAAKRLGISKSIVSRRIARLEAELGTRFLSRTTRGISPTEAGLEFKARSERILAELEEAREAVAQQAGGVVGRLRLSAPLSFGVRHVAPVLAEIAQRHPRLELDVSYSDRIVDLIGERFDAAIRIGTLQDSSLVARRIAPVRSVLVASPDYLARKGRPSTPHELAAHECLIYTGRTVAEWQFLAGKRPISIRPEGRLRSDSGEAILQWAIAGLGIAEEPSFLVWEANRERHARTASARLWQARIRHSRGSAAWPPCSRKGTGPDRHAGRAVRRSTSLGPLPDGDAWQAPGVGRCPCRSMACRIRLPRSRSWEAGMSEQRVKHCRVTRVDTHLVGTRWCNWVFAQVHTDDGIAGIGEGTCEWQATAVEAAIAQLAERYVIGSSAFEIERLWREMFRNEFARGGPILNSAIGAIEMALWDILGKALGQPIHQLLGGRVRDEMPAYANAWYGTGADVGEIAAAAAEVKRSGYPGLKFDPFGSAGRDPDYPAIRRAVQLVEAVREAVGPEIEIMIDCHGRFSPASAIAIGRELEPCRLYWLEEPCDAENVIALCKIGRSIGTRLATGERCYTKHHLQALLRDCEIGVLQPDIIHVGGILEAKKIAAIADASYTPVSFHNPFGPVATAAALQLDACTTNLFMQESFCEYSEPWRFDLVEHAPRPVGGRYQISDLPGLGVGTFQVEAAKAHPFDPKAFLPMWSEDWRKRF